VDERIVNAMSFDVEDWYMGLEIGMERWSGFEKRLGRGLEVVLDELARASARATFFVVGRCAEEHPQLIRRIAEAGHELGTHGYSHTKVYEMTPAAFEEDLARSIRAISDATGHSVRAFRAPYFSITAESRWALDLLARHGIAYDASIYPGPNYRYGIDGSPEQPYLVGDPPIPEFPTSLGRLGTIKFGLGGGYFRILPYAVTRHCIARLNRAGRPVMFYLHPWEFDPGQPRIRMPRRRAQLTHYFRLGVTRRRFARLLADFRFSTASDVLTRMKLLAEPAPASLAPSR
jgi:polysaccharide deacetylase family protein (PEP-CTERM system associated)